MDVAGGFLLYHEVINVHIWPMLKPKNAQRFVSRLLDPIIQAVRKAAAWPTALAQAPVPRPDMVVDWDLVGMEDHLCALCLDGVTFLDQDDEDSV